MKAKLGIIMLLLTLFCGFALFPQPARADTIERWVIAMADDAEEGNGGMDLDSDDLDFGDKWVGVRFQDVQIPQGAAITNAYLEFVPDDDGSSTTTTTVHGEAHDNAPVFLEGSANDYNISNRTRTTASVTWNIPAWTSAMEDDIPQPTPPLSDIVQQIVNRSGWSAGHAMVFIFTQDTGTREAYNYKRAVALGNPQKAPKLHISFTADTTYTIDAGVQGSGGSIAPSGAVSVSEGADQGFAITPDLGYRILDVVVDGHSEGAIGSYTFTNVSENGHTIVATFEEIAIYTITAGVDGSGGSIAPSGAVSVSEGSDRGFAITADSGYTILDVKVDGASQGAKGTYTFTNVSENHTIVATFEAATTYTITATAGNNGSISPSGAVTVTEGEDQGFTMTPDLGYSVEDVLVDGASIGPEATYTFSEVDGDHTIEVSFVEGSVYTIIAVAGNGGTILPSGTITLHGGDSQAFEITPNAGNSVLDVEVNGVSIGAPTTKTFSNVTQSYTIVAYFNVSADDCVDFSSVPLDSMVHAAPANIMFVIDNSSSMGWETFTKTHDKGWFKGRYSIFHTPGGYSSVALIGDPTDESPSRQIDLRMYWKSQWAPHVKMYYDPSYTYESWPNKPDANPDTPKLDPMGSSTRDMSTTWFLFDNGDGNPEEIDIKFAHYYVWSAIDDMPYLVIIDGGQITYYEVTITGTGEDEVVTALEIKASPPADVQSTRSYTDERQNFANYFTFYRKRIYAAKAAVGNVIASMEGVKAGVYTIHDDVRQPVVPINCEGADETDYLLGVLYSFGTDSGSPIRGGLQAVGRYFDKHDNLELDGTAGDDSPWATAAGGGECQQAFAILMSDAHWDTDDSGYVNRGDEDGDNDTDFDGPPYADGHNQANTLADMAMYYYERDLNEDLFNKVPMNLADSAIHQHMVTYAVSFGVTGTLDPDEYDENLINKTTDQPVQWPEVNFASDDDTKIDDMWHAAVNGRGMYLSAGNPGELVSALVDIMQNLASRIGSASSVSVSGDDLYGTLDEDTVMFQTTYTPGSWAGDVKAYDVNPTTGEVLMDPPLWSASEKLDSKQWTTRVLATWDPIATTGREFTYNKLTATQKSQINSDPDIVDYLSGDRTLEVQNGGAFRSRSTVLGDIVHSSPVFQEDASGTGYLYVGANDGMMHCLNASTGVEQFAYVPNLVFENLAWYANPDYVTDHKYYVDLSPVVTPNVDQGGSTMTVLVGGLGRGGKGYYALDVTTPASMSTGAAVAGKVLWEYGNDDDLGYTYSTPTIVDSNIDSNSKGTGWIVITGNGYASVNGTAALFILDPFEKGVIKKINVGNGPCNGLSTPAAIDVNSDGKVDYVYAGDLKGNLWKFDLTDPDSTNNWDVAYKDGGTPKPLFQCPAQPITTQPDVMEHCDKFGYMVIFGTGKYLGATDLDDTSLQSIFGIWDYGDDDDNTEYLGTFTRGATPQLSHQPDSVTLLRQTYVPSTESDPHFWTVGDNKCRILTANTPDWTTTSLKEDSTCGDGSGETDCDTNGTGSNPDPLAHAGWYFDLPIDGERVVSDVMIRENKVIVLSFMAQEDPCGSGGNSIIHEIDACSGGRMQTPQFDIDGSDSIGSGDLINIGTEQDPVLVAPTGLKKEGRLQPPAILRLNKDEEMKYYGSSTGDIENPKGPAVTLGIGHWRLFR